MAVEVCQRSRKRTEKQQGVARPQPAECGLRKAKKTPSDGGKSKIVVAGKRFKVCRYMFAQRWGCPNEPQNQAGSRGRYVTTSRKRRTIRRSEGGRWNPQQPVVGRRSLIVGPPILRQKPQLVFGRTIQGGIGSGRYQPQPEAVYVVVARKGTPATTGVDSRAALRCACDDITASRLGEVGRPSAPPACPECTPRRSASVPPSAREGR